MPIKVEYHGKQHIFLIDDEPHLFSTDQLTTIRIGAALEEDATKNGMHNAVQAIREAMFEAAELPTPDHAAALFAAVRVIEVEYKKQQAEKDEGATSETKVA